MPLYFAYGANMDVAAMASRAPGSKPLGLARLPRHRVFINTDGYASVKRDPRAEVWGLLWDLALGDVKALDRFEGLDRGLYAKINQAVLTPDGPRRAIIYVATRVEPGSPRPGYLETVVAAAEAIGLPAAYCRELAGTPPSRPAGPVAGVTPRFSRPGAAQRATDTWKWNG